MTQGTAYAILGRVLMGQKNGQMLRLFIKR